MLNIKRANIQEYLSTGIILSLCSLMVFKLQLPRLFAEKTKSNNNSISELNRDIEAKKSQIQILKNTPTFGYDNLVANLIFLDFIQYFGDNEAREKTGYELSPDYFQVILDRDPRFLNAYFTMSTVSSIYAGKPEESIAIMNEKLKLLSPKDPDRAYYIWRYKGVDELLFLGDLEASEHSFEKAAEWASVYSNEEGKRVAQLSRQTAQFLASKPDLTQAQIGGWQLVYNNAQDDRTRQIAIERMEALGAIVSIDSNGRLTIAMPESNN